MTADGFSRLLAYEPDTGVLRWLVNRTRVSVGTIAGCRNSRGYIGIRVLGREYKAHRLAWLLTHGQWPQGDIDHINGIVGDNRIANLRDVPRAENLQNQRRAHRDSRSGILGVYLMADGRYISRITKNYKRHELGIFQTAVEASAAYLKAKSELHAGCQI
jgi:hypothetical protein